MAAQSLGQLIGTEFEERFGRAPTHSEWGAIGVIAARFKGRPHIVARKVAVHFAAVDTPLELWIRTRTSRYVRPEHPNPQPRPAAVADGYLVEPTMSGGHQLSPVIRSAGRLFELLVGSERWRLLEPSMQFVLRRDLPPHVKFNADGRPFVSPHVLSTLPLQDSDSLPDRAGEMPS